MAASQAARQELHNKNYKAEKKTRLSFEPTLIVELISNLH
jgi:hypothetical protein